MSIELEQTLERRLKSKKLYEVSFEEKFSKTAKNNFLSNTNLTSLLLSRRREIEIKDK